MNDTQIDFVSDNNPAVFSYLLDNGMVPMYVQESRPVTQEECDALDKVAFADPYNRLFPCHTKEACWQSAAYVAGKNIQDSSLRANIVKIASLHGIKDDVEKVLSTFDDKFTKAAAAIEPAQPMCKYAFVMDFQGVGGRGKEGYYPINNAGEVYSSALSLSQDYNRGFMPIDAMYKIAGVILEAAEETGLNLEEIPQNVYAFGERRLPDVHSASINIGCRKQASVDMDPYNAIMKSLVTDMEKAATHEEGMELAEKAASAIASVDRENNIRYNAVQLNPYELLFTGPTVGDMMKAAAQCITIAGVTMPSIDLVNISRRTIDSIFSAREAGVIKAAQEVLSGLPSIEKRAAAEEKLSTLSENSAKVLLTTAANTGW